MNKLPIPPVCARMITMRRAFLLPLFCTILPGFAGDLSPISVQWEWIRLPHGVANKLIHQEWKSVPDAGALHGAVQELVTKKEAVRLDNQGVVVGDGDEAKLDSRVEMMVPTEFSPPLVSQTLTVEGPDFRIELAPAVPQSYMPRKLGRAAELAASITEDGQRIQLRFTPQWAEHLGSMSYGQGLAEVQQPVIYEAQCEADLQLTSGAWQLAGIFTPPPVTQKDVRPELASQPSDRVMLFVRASAPGLPANPPKQQPNDEEQVAVLAEWIEMECAEAAELMLATPDATAAGETREAVNTSLTTGKARLIETAMVPCRLNERAKISSVRLVPYPTTFNAPMMPQTLTLTGTPPKGLAAGTYAPWITPSLPGSFTYCRAGVTMEVECSQGESGDQIELSIAPELCSYLGGEAFGLGPAMGYQPRIQILKSAGTVSLKPGNPALFSVMDAPAAAGELPGSVRSRNVMLFVTILR